MSITTPFNGSQNSASMASWIAISEMAGRHRPTAHMPPKLLQRSAIHARIRVVENAERLFAAPALCTRDIQQIPASGSIYEDESGSYTVVRVLTDVAPDHGEDIIGPIIFVVKR